MANKIYVTTEADILVGSEAGDDVALSSESIADNAGRQSANIDLGAYPNTLRYLVEAWTQAQATPTLGTVQRWHAKLGGATGATPDHWTNDDGEGDIALSAQDKLRNCPLLVAIFCDEAAANIEFSAKAIVDIPTRWLAVIEYNDLGSAVTTDAAETKLRLTPLPDEIQ